LQARQGRVRLAVGKLKAFTAQQAQVRHQGFHLVDLTLQLLGSLGGIGAPCRTGDVFFPLLVVAIVVPVGVELEAFPVASADYGSGRAREHGCTRLGVSFDAAVEYVQRVGVREVKGSGHVSYP